MLTSEQVFRSELWDILGIIHKYGRRSAAIRIVKIIWILVKGKENDVLDAVLRVFWIPREYGWFL